jgi:hypothetical protein
MGDRLEDGGPAFPSSAFAVKTYSGQVEYVPLVGGMSLRDYFAGQVAAGMAARDLFDAGQATPQQRAAAAYLDADALLNERAKRPPDVDAVAGKV